MKTIDIADEDVQDFCLVLEAARDNFDFSGDEQSYNQKRILNYVLEQFEPTPEETKEMFDYLNSEIKNKK